MLHGKCLSILQIGVSFILALILIVFNHLKSTQCFVLEVSLALIISSGTIFNFYILCQDRRQDFTIREDFSIDCEQVSKTIEDTDLNNKSFKLNITHQRFPRTAQSGNSSHNPVAQGGQRGMTASLTVQEVLDVLCRRQFF